MSDEPSPKPLRDERGRLLPGQTANRKGRPKTGTALAEMIREHVDPLELIQHALDFVRGRPIINDVGYQRSLAAAREKGEPDPPIEGVEVQWPSDALRMSALQWLSDRGWQKPVVQTELTVGAANGPLMDMNKLSQEDLDKLEELQAKAAGIVTADQAAHALDVKTRG